MRTDRTSIAEKARKKLGVVFTSQYHHPTDEDYLQVCNEALHASKAVAEDDAGTAKLEIESPYSGVLAHC